MELGREGRWGKLLWGEGMVEVNLKNACFTCRFGKKLKNLKKYY